MMVVVVVIRKCRFSSGSKIELTHSRRTRIEPLRFGENLTTFEETTNHLNRHSSITFAFDCCYRLSRDKIKKRRKKKLVWPI